MQSGSLFDQAVRHFQAGQIAEAQRLCQRLLAVNPNDLNALYLIGLMALQSGAHQAAIDALSRAVAINGQAPQLHDMLGEASRAAGRFDAAVEHYRRAIALAPNIAPIHANLGAALLQQGKAEAAVEAFRRAIALGADTEATHNNLGNALAQLGMFDEAVAEYRRALALNPSYLPAHNNLGDAHRARGELEEAAACYRQALTLRPEYALALCNLGLILAEQGQLDEAIACHRRAIRSAPNFAAAHHNLGTALRAARAPLREALTAFSQALALAPDFTPALYNRAETLREMGRDDDAIRDYERLVALAPDFDFARGNLRHAKMLRCDWAGLDEDLVQIETGIAAGLRTIPPFMVLGLLDDPWLHMTCAQVFHEHENPVAHAPLAAHAGGTRDRLRVAYLSADFRSHAISHLMMGLLQAHDRTRFDLTAISFGPQDDVTERLETIFDDFVDVRTRRDDEVARLMREREIDIAVDLMGYTAGARSGILAWRPAPLQVNFLGYPGTMGVGHVDYIIADRWVIPEDRQGFFSEKIVSMPDAYQPTDTGREVGPAPSRLEAGLPAQGFVFCSFNRSYKILPAMFDIWMRLLRQVEGSVLWLLDDTPLVARNLRREAAARDVAPGRLIFAPRVAPLAHLARHRLADLFLDTLPYNAHTTASDALWAGLPLVTSPGASFPTRVAASLLAAAGLPELIAPTPAEYEALALALARDPARLAALKAKLAQNRATCALFDTDRYRRHLERAYETMWARHLRGEPPESFAVAPIDG